MPKANPRTETASALIPTKATLRPANAIGLSTHWRRDASNMRPVTWTISLDVFDERTGIDLSMPSRALDTPGRGELTDSTSVVTLNSPSRWQVDAKNVVVARPGPAAAVPIARQNIEGAIRSRHNVAEPPIAPRGS